MFRAYATSLTERTFWRMVDVAGGGCGPGAHDVIDDDDVVDASDVTARTVDFAFTIRA